MKLAEELRARGLVEHSSADLETILDEKTRTVYLGIDPTADAIHVGNLVPYILLNHLINAGHKAILLMGGGTALIGDPSGRDSEREFVEESVVQERCEHMEENIRSITTGEVQFVNNYDWLSKLPMIVFLRDVGKHFTVNTLIKKESVAKRLENEHGISYTEFSYALLQSYDFFHLHREYGCDLQIGGGDQWGNVSAGIDYIRRVAGAEVYGITAPLVIDEESGVKFGKSMGNAVWLDPNVTSPYSFYQFWFNTSDGNVERYLKLFTFLPLDEIDSICESHRKEPGARTAQRALAHTVTEFVHGTENADMASRVSDILFTGGALDSLSDAEAEMLRNGAPSYQLAEPIDLATLLVEAGLAASKREARTFITDGAVELAGTKVTDPQQVIKPSETPRLLRRGKRNVSVLT